MTTKVMHMGEEVEVGTRLYVGNLSYRVRWQDLKDFFSRNCGSEVVYADVKSDQQGRSAGCGIVELNSSQEAADAMLQMHDTEIEGRKIFVRQDRADKHLEPYAGRGMGYGNNRGRGRGGKGGGGRGASDGACKVFVQNIAWETSWQTLKDHFRQAGDVTHADIMTDYKTGRPSGNAIVEFAHPSNPAEVIAQMNEVPLDGRPLYVREDRGKREY